MARDPDAGVGTILGRGVRARCPRCGATGIFARWGVLREWCGECGFRFEREAGYFVGAMIINTVVTLVLTLAVLVVGMWSTWPTVPWVALFAATVVVAGLGPVLLYPVSKTLWMAIEMSFHRLEESERLAAIERLEAG
jgi:uncharacterized protein (DUF983 family)